MSRFWDVNEKNVQWVPHKESLLSDSLKREDIIELSKKDPDYSKVTQIRDGFEDKDKKDSTLREKNKK